MNEVNETSGGGALPIDAKRAKPKITIASGDMADLAAIYEALNAHDEAEASSPYKLDEIFGTGEVGLSGLARRKAAWEKERKKDVDDDATEF